jgi:predicted component of type VI protein secretion system
MGVRITVRSLWTKTNASTFVYEFAQSRIVIGRSRSADVQLPHTAVSATHATIREQDAGYVLMDEGSTNGTRVNELLAVPRRPKALRRHDVVDLGGYRLTMEVGVPVAQTTSARLIAEHARRMLAEQLGLRDDPELDVELAAIQRSPDEHVELLPIPNGVVSEPPPTRESRPPLLRESTPAAPPNPQRSKLGRSEIAVYALAAVVVATSVVAMALLMRH